MATTLGSWGYGAILGVPFAIGCILAHGLRASRGILGLSLVGVALILATGAVTADQAGLVCIAVLLWIFLVPALIGMFFTALAAFLIGLYMRKRHLRFLQRLAAERQSSLAGDAKKPIGKSLLPMLLLLVLVGTVIQLESGLAGHLPSEAIRTSRILPYDAATAWDALVFYEEVRHDPPWLARIGLPRPLSTRGRITGVGDLKRCTYDKGRLIKRITDHSPGELLAFDVVEQRGIEDRSVRLIGGSFFFEPLDAGRTRVTLTTVYEPLLSARAVWRPFEIAIARALHRHVLEGIDIEAGGTDRALEARSRP